MIPSTLRNSILAAAGALALALVTPALVTPAQADPPWRHDGPPGWSKHHGGPHRHGWRHWDDRAVVYDRRGPAYYVYDRPRVIHVPPPPVVYLPRRSAGVDIHLPLPLPY